MTEELSNLKEDLDAELNETRNIARKYAKDIMIALVHICLDNKNSAATRIQASQIILDRSFGKAAQAVEVTNKNPNNFIGILRELRPSGMEVVNATVEIKEDNQLSLLENIDTN